MSVIVDPSSTSESLNKASLNRARHATILFLFFTTGMFVSTVTVDQVAGLEKSVTWAMTSVTLCCFSVTLNCLFFCRQIFCDIVNKTALGQGEICRGKSYFSGSSWAWATMLISSIVYFAGAGSVLANDQFMPLRVALLTHSVCMLACQYYIVQPLGGKVEFVFRHNILLPNLEEVLGFLKVLLRHFLLPFEVGDALPEIVDAANLDMLEDGSTLPAAAAQANAYYLRAVAISLIWFFGALCASLVYGVDGFQGNEFYLLGSTLVSILAYGSLAYCAYVSRKVFLAQEQGEGAATFTSLNNAMSWFNLGVLGPVALALVLYGSFYGYDAKNRIEAMVPLTSFTQLFVFFFFVTLRMPASVAALYKAKYASHFFLHGSGDVFGLFAHGALPFFTCFPIAEPEAPKDKDVENADTAPSTIALAKAVAQALPKEEVASSRASVASANTAGTDPAASEVRVAVPSASQEPPAAQAKPSAAQAEPNAAQAEPTASQAPVATGSATPRARPASSQSYTPRSGRRSARSATAQADAAAAAAEALRLAELARAAFEAAQKAQAIEHESDASDASEDEEGADLTAVPAKVKVSLGQ